MEITFRLDGYMNVEYVQSCPEGLTFDRLMSRCERRSNKKCACMMRLLSVLERDQRKKEKMPIQSSPWIWRRIIV
ncbi:hypothetical protein GCK72_004530 [Caenorhabditis remanei]|uniref:Uncharacterized protein n=1 Tax=Caenorhabditis remanei TaxID=31234 RepID=A0A6A5HCF6_CAERE|nr:hypothetical protein GCK72_004530 [Caenorhabditis remanei]KAF1764581.1 hypothetical protein GCK72_004530 [Caenorhabditis remanei]